MRPVQTQKLTSDAAGMTLPIRVFRTSSNLAGNTFPYRSEFAPVEHTRSWHIPGNETGPASQTSFLVPAKAYSQPCCRKSCKVQRYRWESRRTRMVCGLKSFRKYLENCHGSLAPIRTRPLKAGAPSAGNLRRTVLQHAADLRPAARQKPEESQHPKVAVSPQT